jgi:hypothetical protein
MQEMIFNYYQILILISGEPIIICIGASICMKYIPHLLIIILLLLLLLLLSLIQGLLCYGNNDVRVASDLMKQGKKTVEIKSKKG